MRTVDIFTYHTIRGRARDGAGGYVMALEKDGVPDDLHAVRAVFGIRDKTQLAAGIFTITEAVRRLREEVELRIWTDDQLIASAVSNGWLKKWEAEGFEGKKNAEEWEDFLRQTEGVGIDPAAIIWKVKEHHPYSEYLKWETKREENKGGRHNV